MFSTISTTFRAFSTLLFLLLTIPVSSTDTSLLFDPGPSHNCFSYDGPSNQQNTVTDGCHDLHGTGHTDDESAPTWHVGQYGLDYSLRGKYPGFDRTVSGNDGTPLTLEFTTNVRTKDDCGVTIHENGLNYDYPGYAIDKQYPSDTQYNLHDYDEIHVSYDVEIINATSPDAGYKCPYQRTYWLTDFIYYFNDTCDESNVADCSADGKRVFSIKLFDPRIPDRVDQPSDARFEHACPDMSFCSLMVNEAPRLKVEQQTHVELEFKGLIEKWSAALNHTGNADNGSADRFPLSAYL